MKESKQTVRLNESQLKTLIKKILNETMQDQVPGMPRFNSREEYNQWRQQQKALTKGMDDDEYDKTTYGQFEKAKTDRYWNQIANLDGKKVYQPVGDAGLTFNDFKDRQQKGKTNDGVYRNFVQKRTQTMPNGGKKWVQNVAESQLNQIIKESIKKILNEDYSRAFELIEELKNCGLSSDDILRDLIGRIGGYAAEKYLLDIKRVEIGSYCDDDEDDLASNQLS